MYSILNRSSTNIRDRISRNRLTVQSWAPAIIQHVQYEKGTWRARFPSDDEIKAAVDKHFEDKDGKYFFDLKALNGKCKKCIKVEGDYIEKQIFLHISIATLQFQEIPQVSLFCQALYNINTSYTGLICSSCASTGIKPQMTQLQS